MEVPRQGVQSELQLLAYARATATSDPSCICDLHHSSRQCQILNPLSEARDGTHNLIVPSRICFRCAMMETPIYFIYLFLSLCLSLFFGLFAISWAAPAAYGDSQARGLIRAVAASLRQSHNNVGSEPCLRPTPQLTAVLDPKPTEQGQGPNPQPHGS